MSAPITVKGGTLGRLSVQHNQPVHFSQARSVAPSPGPGRWRALGFRSLHCMTTHGPSRRTLPAGIVSSGCGAGHGPGPSWCNVCTTEPRSARSLGPLTPRPGLPGGSRRGDRGATAALSEPVEEREAPARERLAASLLGEHAAVDAVAFDEPVAERDQGAGVQRPSGIPAGRTPTRTPQPSLRPLPIPASESCRCRHRSRPRIRLAP